MECGIKCITCNTLDVASKFGLDFLFLCLYGSSFFGCIIPLPLWFPLPQIFISRHSWFSRRDSTSWFACFISSHTFIHIKSYVNLLTTSYSVMRKLWWQVAWLKCCATVHFWALLAQQFGAIHKPWRHRFCTRLSLTFFCTVSMQNCLIFSSTLPFLCIFRQTEKHPTSTTSTAWSGKKNQTKSTKTSRDPSTWTQAQ